MHEYLCVIYQYLIQQTEKLFYNLIVEIDCFTLLAMTNFIYFCFLLFPFVSHTLSKVKNEEMQKNRRIEVQRNENTENGKAGKLNTTEKWWRERENQVEKKIEKLKIEIHW